MGERKWGAAVQWVENFSYASCLSSRDLLGNSERSKSNLLLNALTAIKERKMLTLKCIMALQSSFQYIFMDNYLQELSNRHIHYYV